MYFNSFCFTFIDKFNVSKMFLESLSSLATINLSPRTNFSTILLNDFRFLISTPPEITSFSIEVTEKSFNSEY